VAAALELRNKTPADQAVVERRRVQPVDAAKQADVLGRPNQGEARRADVLGRQVQEV
jgi:hypothetical protein